MSVLKLEWWKHNRDVESLKMFRLLNMKGVSSWNVNRCPFSAGIPKIVIRGEMEIPEICLLFLCSFPLILCLHLLDSSTWNGTGKLVKSVFPHLCKNMSVWYPHTTNMWIYFKYFQGLPGLDIACGLMKIQLYINVLMYFSS